MTERGAAPASSPGSSATLPSPRPWRPRLPWEPGLTVAVAAIAVVMLLLLSLALMGGSPGSSIGGASGVAYSTARSVAAASAPLSGGWNLTGALGLDLATSTILPLNITTDPNCTVRSFLGPLPSSINIPAFAGDLASGVATEWLLAYVQVSTGYQMAVAVTDGVANLAVEVSGPPPVCASPNGTAPGVPGNAVNSPAAAAAVAAAGGSAFLQSHPRGVSLEMILHPAAMILAPEVLGQPVYSEWYFGYSTCSLGFGTSPTTGPPGESFSATVNGSSGEVVPNSVSNSTCNAPPPLSLGSALHFGVASLGQGAGTGGTLSSQGCTSGDYCYSIPITLASDNVTPGDFEVEVTGPTGTEFPAVGCSVLNATGEVIVYAYAALETEWTAGIGNSTTLLTTNMTLTVDMGTADPLGANYKLMLTGTGPFANSGLGFGLP